jgi:ABC-type branched-subunit amino acid transport system substrate-binding protein
MKTGEARSRSASIGVSLCAAMVLMAAACGDDDDTGGAPEDVIAEDTAAGDTAAGDTAAEDTAAEDTAAGDTAAEDTAAGEPTGEPIRVMTIGTLGTAEGATTSIEQTAQAYEGWINANGGLGPDGQPLEVIFCNDQDSPEGGRECANEAVEQGVVALVGGYSIQGSFEILPVLEEAGIPWLGLGLLGGGVETSSMSYPVVGGSITEWMAIGQQVASEGCETAGVIRWAAGPGEEAQAYFGHGLATGGGVIGPVAPVGFDATDLVPAVAVASDGVDCMMFGMSPEQGALTVRAAQELGVDIPLAFYPDAVTPQSVEATGGSDSPADGGTSASWFPAADEPVWDEAKAAVEQYASDPGAINFTDGFNFQITWVAFKALENILGTMESLDGLDGAALIEHLDSGESFETGGFTRPVQFVENVPVQVPGGGEATRIFNPDVVLLTIADGTYHCIDEGCEFQDMTDLMLSFEAPPGEEGGGPPEGGSAPAETGGGG